VRQLGNSSITFYKASPLEIYHKSQLLSLRIILNQNKQNITIMVAEFYGLRGGALKSFIIWAVICPAYILFGWNNALLGGLLTLDSWIETFPRIDTLNTTGQQNAENARIQGGPQCLDFQKIPCISALQLIHVTVHRHGRGHLHVGRLLWRYELYLARR
jgi:hypothetical protein